MYNLLKLTFCSFFLYCEINYKYGTEDYFHLEKVWLVVVFFSPFLRRYHQNIPVDPIYKLLYI